MHIACLQKIYAHNILKSIDFEACGHRFSGCVATYLIALPPLALDDTPAARSCQVKFKVVLNSDGKLI